MNFLALRIFDKRRYGMLLEQYRRSKVWTLPMTSIGEEDPFLKVLEMMKVLAPAGKIISVILLMEHSEEVPGADSTTETWQSYVYEVELDGEINVEVLPERIAKRVFIPYAEMDAVSPAMNHTTSRFYSAMRKHECLR